MGVKEKSVTLNVGPRVVDCFGNLMGLVDVSDKQSLNTISLSKLSKYGVDLNGLLRKVSGTLYVINKDRMRRIAKKLCKKLAEEFGGELFEMQTTSSLMRMDIDAFIILDKAITRRSKSKMKNCEGRIMDILSDMYENPDYFELYEVSFPDDNVVEVEISGDLLIQLKTIEGICNDAEIIDITLDKYGDLKFMTLSNEQEYYVLDRECALYYINEMYGVGENCIGSFLETMDNDGVHITRSDCEYNKSISSAYLRYASEVLYASLVCGEYGKAIVDRLVKSSKVSDTHEC